MDKEERQRRLREVSHIVNNIGRKIGDDDIGVDYLRDYILSEDLKQLANAMEGYESISVCYALANDCQGIFPCSIYHRQDEALSAMTDPSDHIRPVLVIDLHNLKTDDTLGKFKKGLS